MWKFILAIFLVAIPSCNPYNNPQYTHDLAREHFRLVPYFAKPFIKKHKLGKYDRDELLQEGYIGLIYACRKYDPSFNVELSTYSSYWIRSYIGKYLKKKHNTQEPSPLIMETYIERIHHDYEAAIDLRLAMESLEPWDYDFIRKRFFDKMTIKQMAIEYNLTRNTVSKHSTRITNKLKGHMQRQNSQPRTPTSGA
tara:strand:+ start:1094 stop:1681 length:588 start_codon:yes stop_codon:yes gene_type:complete